jgi:signal transduction histidine kinase
MHPGTDFILAHAVIVGMLAITTIWACRFQRGFAFIASGWITRLVGLAAALVTLGETRVTVVQEFAVVIAGGCFCAAAIQRSRRPLVRWGMIGCGVSLLLCAVVIFEVFMPRFVALAELVTAFSATAGGVGLALAYTRFGRSYRSLNRVLRIGVWLYTLVQALLAFIPAAAWWNIADIFAEGCIAVGTIGYVVAAAEEVGRSAQLRARDLSATTGRILHEIATPVAQIGMHSTRLLEVVPTGRLRRHAEALENARQRLTATIEAARLLLPTPDTVITLPSVVTTATDLPHLADEQVVNANTLVQLALMAVKETRSERARVLTTYAHGCCFRCRPVQITSAIINLLRNSYDAFPEGSGTVKITTGKGDDRSTVLISIEDDGEGISHELQSTVFEAGVTTRSGIGRGYGLSVVRDTVDASGGVIELMSPATRNPLRPGVRITLLFPALSCTGHWQTSPTN